MSEIPATLGTRESFRAHLALLLASIEANDEQYHPRQSLVLYALSMALRAGLEAGVRIDPEEPEWPVVFIELPEGQVSWHLRQHPHSWDGHDTEAKYLRCRRFIESQCG